MSDSQPSTPARRIVDRIDAAFANAGASNDGDALDVAGAEIDMADSAEKPARKGKKKDKQRKAPRVRQSDGLVALLDEVSLWHSPTNEGFATFTVGDHRESWPLRSQNFRRKLALRSYKATGAVPGAQAIDDAVRVLEAKAIEEGPEIAPWLRVGQREGCVFVDLCDGTWQVVEVNASGFHIRENGDDLPFIRTAGMMALPEPVEGESIDRLRRFVNVASEDDFCLTVSWLVAAMRPTGPYPILCLNGEQGSGKSTFSRLLRCLTDPNVAPIRAAPKDDRDLVVAASNSHMLVLDNVSKIDANLADSLCRLATGSGFSTRALHTDRDEVLFMASRPAILNGIPNLTDRADLADRSVTIRLRSIPETDRLPEDEFWADFERASPEIFGALLTAVSGAIRKIDGVRLTRYPRLADFARWATAAESGLGWDDGTFMRAYGENRKSVTDSAFEADVVAVAIADLVQDEPLWSGTPTALLAALNQGASEQMQRAHAWPKTPAGLGNRLERIAPLLRTKGILVERRHSGTRSVTITAAPRP